MNSKLKSVFSGDPDIMGLLQERETNDLIDRIGQIQLIKGDTGQQGEKGDKGETGEMGPKGEEGKTGPQGVQGIQGERGKNGRDGADGKNGTNGIDGLNGTNGTDATFDKQAFMEELLDYIKKKKPIDISHIRNADSFIFGGKKYKIHELMHGGGSTTSSGLNVTTQYLLTATQDGDNVLIDLSQLTNFATFQAIITIYRNNVPQTEGINFAFANPIVTIFGASSDEIFNSTYSYI